MSPDERIVELQGTVRNLDRIVCGPPSLEERLRIYVDSMDGHKARNAKQDSADIREALKDEKAYRDTQHTDNQTQFRQLFRLVYIGVGILIALHALDYLIIPAMLKH